MNQTNVNTLEIRFAQPRSNKVAGQELQEAEVGCNQVVNMLLSLGKRLLVSGSEFLLAVERIRVAGSTLVAAET